MNKVGWHTQWIPPWCREVVNGPFKTINPPDGLDLPGATFIVGRTMVDDRESDRLVLAGAVGADEWFIRHLNMYKTRPMVDAWEGPNEPGSITRWVFDANFIKALDTFTVRFCQLMHEHGKKVVGHNFSVGCPQLHMWKHLEKSLAVVDYLGLHEYCAPYMDYEEWDEQQQWGRWWTLRYKKVVQILKDLGYRVPQIVIGECGIDGGVRTKANNPTRPEVGWQGYIPKGVDGEQWYLEQLAWYDRMISADPIVKSAHVFTSGWYSPWESFNVGESLSRKMAAYDIGSVIPVPIPAPPVPVPDYTPKVHHVEYKIPRHPTKRYPTRRMKDITQIVIHHTGVMQRPKNNLKHIRSVARYHISKWDWAGIGYHYVVAANGDLFRTNRRGVISNHAGPANPYSVGVCFMGRFDKKVKYSDLTPTPEQIKTFRWLQERLKLPAVPHKDIMQTACPGKDWYDEIL